MLKGWYTQRKQKLNSWWGRMDFEIRNDKNSATSLVILKGLSADMLMAYHI